MSHTIVASKRFLKSIKSYRRGGKHTIVEAAYEVVELLTMYTAESLSELVRHWRDHPLKGNKRGIREIHLSFDDLLLYRIDQETSTIELLDIVNHEELQKIHG